MTKFTAAASYFNVIVSKSVSAIRIRARSSASSEYSGGGMIGDDADREASRVGLCADCRYMQRIESPRGSIFYLCRRAATDPEFPKYPRLPVLHCHGYDPLK
jgi:hypothetical protein